MRSETFILILIFIVILFIGGVNSYLEYLFWKNYISIPLPNIPQLLSPLPTVPKPAPKIVPPQQPPSSPPAMAFSLGPATIF